MEIWRIFSADFFVRSEFLSTFAVPKRSSASLAQLVEHDTLNVGVQGSSPWGSTNFGTDSVAQLVEHNTFNVGVLGSSPSGITQNHYPQRDSRNAVSLFLSIRCTSNTWRTGGFAVRVICL